jgi:hypothetical protein
VHRGWRGTELSGIGHLTDSPLCAVTLPTSSSQV